MFLTRRSRLERERDHVVANVARAVAGIGALFVGIFCVRAFPDLLRYVKMKRM